MPQDLTGLSESFMVEVDYSEVAQEISRMSTDDRRRFNRRFQLRHKKGRRVLTCAWIPPGLVSERVTNKQLLDFVRDRGLIQPDLAVSRIALRGDLPGPAAAAVCGIPLTTALAETIWVIHRHHGGLINRVCVQMQADWITETWFLVVISDERIRQV